MIGQRLRNGALLVGVPVAMGLMLWGAFHASNEVLFHGFAVSCSDGNPEFDPDYCGITWRAGAPHLIAVGVGLALLLVAVWNLAFTRIVLYVTGSFAVALALFLLWVSTWDPVNPAYPEPGGPQYLLLGSGVCVVALAVILRKQGP